MSMYMLYIFRSFCAVFGRNKSMVMMISDNRLLSDVKCVLSVRFSDIRS